MLQAVSMGYFDYEIMTLDSGLYHFLVCKYAGEFSRPEPCIQCNDLLNTLTVI